jgi:hypothetical protein
VPTVGGQPIGNLTTDLFEQASVSKSPTPPFGRRDVQAAPTRDQCRILHWIAPKRRIGRC